MDTITDMSKLNFHDAQVTNVIVENEEVYFDIPNGLNDDIEKQYIKSCKLKFELVFPDEAKITFSRFLHPKFIRRLHKNLFYKTEEILSLKELSKLVLKYNGFEIINLYFDNSMHYVNMDCVVDGNRPLRIELDIISAELIVERSSDE